MPFGVSKDFLDLTRRGQRRGLTSLATVVLLGLLGAGVAELLDPPRFGTHVLIYLGAVGFGLLLGGLLGWLETRSWGQSLREGWQTWMESAQGASTMGEAAGRAGAMNLALGHVLTGLLIVLNGAVLVASWFQLPPLAIDDPYGALALVTVASTGLAVGSHLVVRLVEAWWCRSVEQQTLTLVEEGRIGVWGVR